MTPSPAEIVVEVGRDSGRQYLLALGDRALLGRGEDVDVLVLDVAASRHHVLVEHVQDGLRVTDLGSRNGTLLCGAPLRPNEPALISSPATLTIGVHQLRLSPAKARSPRVRDEYERLRQLGQGAAGVVFAARHRTSGRSVAIKSLSQRVETKHGVERFLREGRLRIDSPHVVSIFDLRVEDGQAYIIMELVDGVSAGALVRSGPLPIERALHIAEQAALGLAAAHAQGIVHRDIKPDNLLVRSDGVVKVTDFGIAKLRGEGPSLTATSQGMGTLLYVPPEQAEDAKRVSPAADLYALGATLFHLISGRPPFLPGPDLITQLFEDDPPLLSRLRPDCPRRVAALVRDLLEKEPEDRPRSAAGVGAKLRRYRLADSPAGG